MTTTNPLMQAFAFDSHAVRVVTVDGQPWFVAKDVCECLGIDNYRNCIAKLDSDEKGLQSLDTLGGAQAMAVMNESGLYATILRSQGAMTPGTPTHTFRKWVTSEVLPATRQTGCYTTATAQPMDAKLDRLLDGIEKLLAVIPHTLEVLTHMASAMPRMLEATQGNSRQKRTARRMYAADAARILALRAKGYLLDDLVLETEFSQTQCWCVINGLYKELESGRISIDARSERARAADSTAKTERSAVQPGLLNV